MINAFIASAALLGTGALAGGMGSAVVVNKCSYDVSLSNVPASGGGYSTVDQKLSAGDTYSQTWTALSNTMGWSIKLFKGQDMSNILQYEYTCHEDGIIWYDLSEVNGNPWDKNWEITATGNCSPRQAAYRYATDDAYGMQDCPEDSTITVTLCSGESGGAAPSGGAPSSPAESAPASEAPSSEAPSTYAPQPSTHWGGHSWGNKIAEPASTVEDKKAAPVDPSTLDTSSVPVSEPPKDPNAVYVTNVHTEYITHTVTAEAPKRHHTHHARRHGHQ